MDLKHQNLSRHVYEISWDVTISDCHLLFFFREYMLWLWYNKNFNCFEKENLETFTLWSCFVNSLYLFDRYLLGLCYKLKMAFEVWMWVRMWLDFMIFQTCFVLSVAHHLSFCDTATRGLLLRMNIYMAGPLRFLFMDYFAVVKCLLLSETVFVNQRMLTWCFTLSVMFCQF